MFVKRGKIMKYCKGLENYVMRIFSDSIESHRDIYSCRIAASMYLMAIVEEEL